ncbi:MAG: DUF3489 domain-containing protein [Rhodobacteraceae bacterium]|nr:DUF3489 domain-containing protein [Paracoccaceae bacterium]
MPSKQTRLTDTQLVILAHASARDDGRLLPLAPSVKARGNALSKALRSLLEKGLVEEVRAKRGEPVWRTEDDGRRVALKITAAGLVAMESQETALLEAGSEASIDSTDTRRSKQGQGDAATTKRMPSRARNSCDSGTRPQSWKHGDGKTPRQPRDGTKAAVVLDLLRRESGASVEELMASCGWQAHSVRGFLSGTVRKKLALPLVSEKGKDGVLRYRIDGAGAA